MKCGYITVLGFSIFLLGCGPREVVSDEDVAQVMSQVSIGDPLELLEEKLFELKFEKVETLPSKDYWDKYGPNTRFDRKLTTDKSVYVGYYWSEKSITGYGERHSVDVHTIDGKIVELLD